MRECKQVKATEVTINEYKFFIHPFSAFTSARIGGDLLGAIGPFISAVLSGGVVSEEDVSNGNVPIDYSAISSALMSISGDKLETILKELLTDQECIYFCDKDERTDTILLDARQADEVFCSNLFGMIKLAVEVIKLNFGGFFTNTGIRFGSLFGK